MVIEGPTVLEASSTLAASTKRAGFCQLFFVAFTFVRLVAGGQTDCDEKEFVDLLSF